MFGNLTMYGRPVPHNARVGFAHSVHIREAAMNPDVVHYVKRLARESIAATIADTRLERKEHDFHVEFRCDLYVFSPNDFWQIVEEAAQEIARRYPVAPP